MVKVEIKCTTTDGISLTSSSYFFLLFHLFLLFLFFLFLFFFSSIPTNESSELVSLINENGNVIFKSEKYGSISAEIPRSLIPVLAERDDVKRVDPPAQAIHAWKSMKQKEVRKKKEKEEKEKKKKEKTFLFFSFWNCNPFFT